MPYPNGFLKVVLAGSMPGGEKWSTTIGVDVTSFDPDPTVIENVLGALDTQLDAGGGGGFYENLGSINAAAVTLDTMTGYWYEGGARAALSAEIKPHGLAAVAAQTCPNQVAMVCSLRTGRPGRSYRGRMYLPCTSITPIAGGLVTGGQPDAVSAALAVAFGAFNASGFGKIVVGSARLGAMTQVTSVQVDDVLDTQRRRRDKLVSDSRHEHAVAS